MTWVAPLAFAWLALLAVVVLFYLLRPRRQRLVVASTLLWQRTLQRQADRTWLDWLKRHLLLILQLLAVATVALALARPESPSSERVGAPAAVVVDASLSMQLADVAPSRLEAAKLQAVAYVRALPVDARISVLVAGARAQPMVLASTDRREVEAAISGIRAAGTDGQVDAALDLALSLAPAERGGHVALFTDGSFTLPVDPRYDRVQALMTGGPAPNVALESFAVRPRLDDPSRIQALAAVRNYGATATDVQLEVLAGRERVRSVSVRVPSSARATVVLDDLPGAAGYEAVVQAGAADLAGDNRAFAEIGAPRALRVLVAGDDPAPVVRALEAVPGIRAAGISTADYSKAEPHDIYVFLGWAPATLPVASLVLVRPPELAALSLTPQAPVSGVALAGRGSPLLAFLDPTTITSADDVPYPVPTWAQADLSLGEAATIAHGVYERRRTVVVGLDVANPAATAEPWYPVLWRNIVRWADPYDPLTGRSAVTPGSTLVLTPHPRADQLEVIRPSGATEWHVARQSVATEAGEAGAYTVRQYDRGVFLAQARFTVQPPAGAGAPEPITSLEGAPPAAAPPAELRTTVEWWPVWAGAGVVLLAAEWWWFHRVRGLR